MPRKGQKHSPETIALMKAKALERDHSHLHTPEARAKAAESQRGQKRSDQARANMKAAAKNRPPVSDETRAKMSAAHKGAKRSQETCEKIRQSKLGSKNPQFGRTHTAATRAKLSAALTGQKRTPEQRKNYSAAAQRRIADPDDPFGKVHRAQIEHNGHLFDSKTELGHYLELCRDPWVMCVEKVRTGDPRHALPLSNGYNFYPDFYVIYEDGFDEYVESKPFATLDEVETYEFSRFGESDIRIKLTEHPCVRLA